jgi:hypothetical protein
MRLDIIHRHARHYRQLANEADKAVSKHGEAVMPGLERFDAIRLQLETKSLLPCSSDW